MAHLEQIAPHHAGFAEAVVAQVDPRLLERVGLVGRHRQARLLHEKLEIAHLEGRRWTAMEVFAMMSSATRDVNMERRGRAVTTARRAA